MLWLFLFEHPVLVALTVLVLGFALGYLSYNRYRSRMEIDDLAREKFQAIVMALGAFSVVFLFVSLEHYPFSKAREIRENQTALHYKKVYIPGKAISDLTFDRAGFVILKKDVSNPIENVFSSDRALLSDGFYLLNDNPDVLSVAENNLDKGLHLIAETYKIGDKERVFLVVDEDYYKEEISSLKAEKEIIVTSEETD